MTASYGVSIILVPHLCVDLRSGQVKLFADVVTHPTCSGFYRTRQIVTMRTLVRRCGGRGRRRFRLSAFSWSGIIYLTRSDFLNDNPTLFIESPNDDRLSASVWYSRTDRDRCIDNTLRVSKCRLTKDGSYVDGGFLPVSPAKDLGFARRLFCECYSREQEQRP